MLMSDVFDFLLLIVVFLYEFVVLWWNDYIGEFCYDLCSVWNFWCCCYF